MSTPLELTINLEHYRKAKKIRKTPSKRLRSLSTTCPIAQALHEAGYPTYEVNDDTITYPTTPTPAGNWHYETAVDHLPVEATMIIDYFDTEQYAKLEKLLPCTFTLWLKDTNND